MTRSGFFSQQLIIAGPGVRLQSRHMYGCILKIESDNITLHYRLANIYLDQNTTLLLQDLII